jgi:hypothetical protein
VIIVGSRDLSSLEIPIHEGRALIVQGQLQGQQWGIVDAVWNNTAEGWYNTRLAKTFKDRWDVMEGDRKASASRAESEDKSQEMDRISASAQDMLNYAPVSLDKKIVYDYRLVDMTTEYAKPNELTAKMAEVQKASGGDKGKKK